MEINKKVVVITGGGGIGSCVASRFYKADYEVVLLDINLEGTRKIASSIGISEDNCYKTDITQENEIKETVDKIMSKFGRIDALVNTAGIVGPNAPIEEYSVKDALKVMTINFAGTFMMMQNVLPIMKKRKKGAIVNFGSISGHHGYATESIYGASKAAIIELTRTAASENGANGVRANSVSPGWVDTNMMRQSIAGFQGSGAMGSYENINWGPMKRPADPMEIAEVVYYLCTDEASFVNGSDIVIDGGKIVS